ncbi:MAG: hypothetical protein ACRD9L_24255 [Bryobacteraceae bacterium]
MAPLIAILNALRRAIQRDLGTFRSIQVNNFFLFIAVLMWGAFSSHQEPVSAEPFLLLLCLLLLFPLSADPLRKIPVSRLSLWPLTGRQRFALRVASTGLSPVVWLAGLVVAITARPAAAGLLIVAALLAQGLAFAARRTLCGLQELPVKWRLPQVRGSFAGLIHNNVRQMLTVLDLYAAALLSAAGVVYRLFGRHPDPSAFPILAILVALTLSTYAQCLFEFDAAGGLTRYRLLPLRGWQILLAKDAAFLGILFVLVAPLHLGAGFTFGLTAVAIGRYPSLRRRSLTRLVRPQRWRFTSGEVRFGVTHIVAGTALGFGEAGGTWCLPIAIAAYVISLWAGGRYWDRLARTWMA